VLHRSCYRSYFSRPDHLVIGIRPMPPGPAYRSKARQASPGQRDHVGPSCNGAPPRGAYGQP
jgi:hypothetical protein